MYLYNVYSIPSLCMMNKQINKNNYTSIIMFELIMAKKQHIFTCNVFYIFILKPEILFVVVKTSLVSSFLLTYYIEMY